MQRAGELFAPCFASLFVKLGLKHSDELPMVLRSR